MSREKSAIKVGVLLLIFAYTAIGVVHGEIVKDPTLCSRIKCTIPAERKFKYEEGISYLYRYSVNVSTILSNEESFSAERINEETTLHIDATLFIYFTSPCEGSLKFLSTSISHDRSNYNGNFPDRAGANFKTALERFALRFAFDDGQVHEVCANRHESIWALNLKRGILSMLQNSMKRFDIDRRVDELDVNGICDTTYRLHEARKTQLIVKKTKNLVNCQFAAKHLSIMQSTPYRNPRHNSRKSRQPLLKSDTECEITIDHNIYEKVICKDTHQLQPLSNGNTTGIRTEIISSLELIEETKNGQEYNEAENEEEVNSNKIADKSITKRTTLLYDHTKTSKTIHGELRTSRGLLKSLCTVEANPDELQQRFSEIFTAFVHSARLLDYPFLSQLFAKANVICKTGKKHIIDALPYMGSASAVNLMKDLIIRKYINQNSINNWITTFALIPRPDYGTVKALSYLLDFESQISDAQFILSYSAVIHAFCSNNASDCTQDKHIKRFLSHLEQKIEDGCASRPQSLEAIKKTLEALKAIGNMGLQTKTLSEKLKICIDDVSGFLPMEVHIAAIDAHRRFPSCEKTRDEFFLDYYRNFTLDSELRTASYLQVMRCPDYNVIKTIKHTLKVEEVNQVGSFVWSHLTNLYSSSSPTRVEIQSLLTDRDLDNKYNSDMRKFSRNYDGSFFSEEYNFGANYQSNLIFSPKTYIPRSVLFNITIDLFGESVNIFEVSSRMEGLEYYAESLFGPNGPYSNEKVSTHWRNFIRSFRAAPEEDYWKRVKRIPNIIDNNFDNPRISLSYKIFGNELKYIMLDGEKEIKSALLNLNPWEKVKQILSGQEIHYENTVMFLDSTYVVPTTSGLPVRLDIAGSGACNFKLSGSLNSSRLVSNIELEFLGNIMPSVSVDVIGTMTVDAFYKSTGIKLQSSVYSSGAVQMHFNLMGTRLIRLNLGLPSHKMEIFSVATNIHLINTNGAETEEKAVGIPKGKYNHKFPTQLAVPGIISNTTCSWQALDRLIGLKMCFDYRFPNVTKNSNILYFILNGPTLLKVSMIKADPSAKSYLLEYKWERTKEESVFKVAFDTPGSQINRELSATVSFDVKSHNVTVLLVSTGNSLIAKGTYKRTENETFIEVGFDINGTKHLDASIGYTKTNFNYGYTYNPRLYLDVNNERVVAISGSVRNTQKDNLSQCDIDITFQTKKVWSKLVGYVVKRNASLAGDFQLDYQLQKMPKKETIHLEVSLANRSSKTLIYKLADLKLHSTAYPQLNTVITAWYQQALGHLELHVEVNSSPHLQDDRHKLTAQLVISYSKLYFQYQNTKINVLVAITKPIQNLDIKVGVNHYAVGTESKTKLLIGYAPGKEITLAVNVIMPRGLMFSFEGHANLTIPNFNSMLIDTRITERSQQEYEIDFAGRWFSGHNITARGSYIDRSTLASMNHNLKLILKSQSFVSNILINCKVHHNHNDLKISLYMEQLDLDKYAFILNHTMLSPVELITYVEGRFKNNVYSIMTNVNTDREIRIEMHMDKWRDVHLTLIGINEENNKEFGFELKWDANRDPALKIASILRINKFTTPVLSQHDLPGRNLSGTITLTYPGRFVTGSCLLAIRNNQNYIMNAAIDWDPDKIIHFSVDVGYNFETWMNSMKLESQLLTPFEQWKKTALNAKYLQIQNKIIASSSAYWKDIQYVTADIYFNAQNYDDMDEWVGNCGLSSTVHSIASITANVTHKHFHAGIMDTRALIKYHPGKVINAWSIWQLARESDIVFNVTGNLHLELPLASYKKCDVKCQLRMLPNRTFQGVATMDIDKRTYTSNLKGDLRQLKESMIQLNLTTPLEKYAYVRARFGLSESNKHMVAEIVTPTGPLGFEAMFQLFTMSHDFHVKLLLATPIDILQKILLLAKLNRREADFRVAYNNITVGFQGVWHYDNIMDFHYTYILFTPLPGFHECGVIAKLIIINAEPTDKVNVDLEFSTRLAETKAGFRFKAGPKDAPVRIPINTNIGIGIMKHSEATNEDISSESEFEEEDEEDNFYWRGEFEIWAVIIEPIIGEIDIENEGSLYKILSFLKIPRGKITFEDHFFIEDVFHMKNELNVVTPFNSINEITSFYVFEIDMEKPEYSLRIDVNIKNNVTWIETGVNGYYTYQNSTLEESNTHQVKLNVKTPLNPLKFIDAKATMKIDNSFYKTNINIRAEDCLIDLIGFFETKDNFLDTMMVVRINSSTLIIPKTKLLFKKDFINKEKHLDLNVVMETPEKKFVTMQVNWQVVERNYLKGSLVFYSWIEFLKSLDVDLLYVNTIEKNNTLQLITNLTYNDDLEFKIAGDYKSGAIYTHLYTPFKSKEYLQFHGNLLKRNDTFYNLEGQLKNFNTSMIYMISTDIITRHDSLSSIQMQIRPQNVFGSDNEVITLTLDKKRYELTCNVNSQYFSSTVAMNLINSFNFDIRAHAIDREKNEKYQLTTFMNVQVDGNTALYMHGETPWKIIRNFTLDGNCLFTNNSGDIRVNHALNEDRYHTKLQWKLLYLIDMYGRMIAEYDIEDFGTKHVATQLFFKNPYQAYRNVDTGFNINIDKEKWRFGANTTIGFRNHENIDAVFAITLPPPDNDDHRFLVSYHANHGVQDMSYVIGYNALRAKTNYASDGSIRMASHNIDSHLRLTWGMLSSQSLNNLLNMTFNKEELELKYSLFTPKFLQEETVVLLFNYDGTSKVHSIIDADVFYPARKKIGNGKIWFTSLENINGTVNGSLPISNFVSYVGCDFVVLTSLKHNKRFIEFFWPNNTALLNSDYSYQSEKLNSNLEGVFQLEIPLNTRHIGHLTYGYKKRPLITTGYTILQYNTQKILDAEYNSKSESRAGFEKDRIEISVKNIFQPIGIKYINQYEYSAGNGGTNYPTVELKQFNIYRLDNSSAFNVAGESKIKTTHTGQDIYLKAIHSNRTVQLKTNYEILSGEFDHIAWLSLADDAWISYHVNILNKTTEDVEKQFLILNFAYPRRNFTVDTFYRVTNEELDSEIKLEWNQKQDRLQTIGAGFNWKNITFSKAITHQQAIISLKHPSFVKDVVFKGEILKKDLKDLLNMTLIVDYSLNPDKLFQLCTILKDESNLPRIRKYVYSISGNHRETHFNLNIEGFFHKHENAIIETENYGKYKRSFLPEETGLFISSLDLMKKELFFHRKNNEVIKYLKIGYYPSYPRYIINGSAIKSPNLNATGAFLYNPQEKLTWMMINYTPDAVESLRMYGKIPDARSSVFDIWRTYDDDFTVSDVSFYLKLNHSRLVTSVLKWRPELKNDIINSVKTAMMEAYESIGTDADYWKQYIKSETLSIISDIWDDAQEELKEFLDDWDNLKELETDFEDLKIYLNNSYNANDFYIKDIVALGIYVIDELSLRSHIQSLPNIFHEIWEIMGESGEAIRNSLLWIIETIKNAYSKIIEIVAAILRGDSVSQVANIIEKLIEKYDIFIKNLHVSFIKDIENLWDKISLSILQQWHKFLKLMEPLFIRMLHYLETMIWKASKEIVDFLYDRRNEIITSPYFDRFTNLTQDIDKFYKDIQRNDIITNIQKYSALIIQFLQERYFTFVPFGKELKDVIDEIITELKELKKLPSVNYTLEKMQQIYNKMNYMYESLQIKTRIENIIRIIHSRLISNSQTALQAESRYREAKTKFIFDINEGIICLEQKLPISWHSFNQTPEFQEIPEYRAIADMKSYFATSNMTFWTFYYQYKSYIEPSNWLPPFKAQAMIIGLKHFKTFDGFHFEFTGSCNTYLLARDFIRDTFAIIIKYEQESDQMVHKLIVLIGDNAVEIDIFKDTVKLISRLSLKALNNLTLPIELENGTTYVYQEEGIVTIERKKQQLRLECNLKFNLCTFELSGWYYGKTAGLFGTMNNEKYDDTIASDGIIQNDIQSFARSWIVNNDNECLDKINVSITKKDANNLIFDFCKEFFVNKTSELSSCFGLLDPKEYNKMCLSSSTKSEACTVIISYMQNCIFHDTYLRIPDQCTTCTMVDGSEVAEGEFKTLEDNLIPKSADIVFIVEAKECNRDVKQNRSIEQLVNQLSKELIDQNLINNRWSLVIFGGDSVYEKPRSVILDGQIFTKNVVRFVDYFDHIPVGHGNQDIFAAIGFASQLIFRAAVSKNFILMPCSKCEPQNQTLDYDVVHQVLLEHDITLHILMDDDFQFEKEKFNKIFYGLDASKTYSKKDARILNGDVDSRKQVILPKRTLGYCTPLALETNGTIFSGNKLRFDKLVAIKKFISVFSKRMALTAIPRSCQHCECTADNNGITQMECIPCVYPTPITMDYETLNVNETLSVLQPRDIDYSQIDVEDN